MEHEQMYRHWRANTLIRLSGAPDIEVITSLDGKVRAYRPRVLAITWSDFRDGLDWVVRAYKVREDGTVSMRDREFHALYWNDVEGRVVPTWITELIETYAPASPVVWKDRP